MRDRSKSLERVLAVQRQVVRLAEWRLGMKQRQCLEIKADQVRLQEFVAGEEILGPLLSNAAFKRGETLLRSLAQREDEVAKQSRHTDTMRRREKLAEQLVDKVHAEMERVAEKRQLEETIEASAWQDDASFP